ncbi:MAG: hypothetical protein WC959_09835 [Kiritimatiellales bacterium]
MKNLIIAGILIALAAGAGAMSRPPCKNQSKHPNPESAAAQCDSEKGTGRPQSTCSGGVCPIPK